MLFKKKFILSAIMLMSLTVIAAKKSHFEDLELFNKVLHLVESQYYRKVDTSKLIEGALKGMMQTLDPHSAYLGPDSFEKMKTDTAGEYGGLGIEVTIKDGTIYIMTPIDDTPAFKAGLRSGDKIVEINHESTLGWTLDDAVEKMKGKAGEKIHLGIKREGDEKNLHFTLTREVIKIKSVKYELLDDKFAFLRLTQFQKNSAKNIVEALKKLRKTSKNQISGIILDLRSNPGGLLDEAVDVSSVFLKDGIVVSTEARDPNNKDIRYVKKTGFKDTDTPLVVLINGASASASEIVAGALQDHSRAIIMGAQSFGKGSVQTVAQIDEKVGVKLTIAQYMTPKKRKIQAIGIEPDIELDEIDGALIAKQHKESRYIREKDLRGHLTATIESAEEKKQREAEEKLEREKRAQFLKNRNQEKQESQETFRRYDPKTDYQVMQAINYLKSFKVFKTL